MPPTVQRHTPSIAEPVARLEDAMRRARSHTARPQGDGDAKKIAKGMLTTHRYRGLEHTIVMLFDAIDRGGPLEDALQFCATLEGLVRARWAAVHGDPFNFATTTLAELHQREEEAQSRKEEAETRFAHDASPRNAALLLQADLAHQTANARYMEFVKRTAVAS